MTENKIHKLHSALSGLTDIINIPITFDKAFSQFPYCHTEMALTTGTDLFPPLRISLSILYGLVQVDHSTKFLGTTLTMYGTNCMNNLAHKL